MSNGHKLWLVPGGFKSFLTPVFDHDVHALLSKDAWFVKTPRIPIVLLHGALASRRYLLPVGNALRKHMKVYIYEMPGHGASSKPTHALSVDEQASIMFEWLRKNKLRHIYLYANSYGCQIAARLAVEHPECISRLILSGPTVDPSAPTVLQQALRLFVDGFLEPPTAQLQMVLDIHDMGVNRGFETAGQMIRNDIKPNLKRIECPTLIVRGKMDPIAPQKWSEKAAKMVPHCYLDVIQNGAHCINYSTPNELTSSILKFLTPS